MSDLTKYTQARAARDPEFADGLGTGYSATLDDVRYQVYVRQKIEQGLEDAAAGRTLSEEEFDHRMAKW